MDDTGGTAQRVFDAYNAHDPGALYDPAARTHRPGRWRRRRTTGLRRDGLGRLRRLAHHAPAFRKRKRTITEVRITGEIALGDFGRAATDTIGGTFAVTGKPLDIMGVHEVGEEDLVVAERHY